MKATVVNRKRLWVGVAVLLLVATTTAAILGVPPKLTVDDPEPLPGKSEAKATPLDLENDPAQPNMAKAARLGVLSKLGNQTFPMKPIYGLEYVLEWTGEGQGCDLPRAIVGASCGDGAELFICEYSSSMKSSEPSLVLAVAMAQNSSSTKNTRI